MPSKKRCAKLTCPLFCGCAKQLIPAPEPPVLPDPILTPEEKAERVRAGVRTLRRIARRRGLRSLAEFVKQSFATKYPGTPLEWGPHIQAICDHIQWQLEDRARVRRDTSASLLAQNMIINCVPRSLKSFIVSCATLWAWVHWPEMKIMVLSSNPRVTLDGARIVRDLIDSEWFLLTYDVSWKIRSDQDALSDLGNTMGGTRAARGMDATVTGAGCNWLIVDDPIDARASTQTRVQVNEGYRSAVHNRINDPRCDIRLLIMQRLGRDDLSGDCLKTGEWLHVRIGATYRKHTTCKCASCVIANAGGKNVFGWADWRKDGELVHPRFTKKFLAGERSRLGSAGYAAQLDQEPVDMQGGMVPRGWWNWFRLSGHTAGEWPRPAGCDEKIEAITVPMKGRRWDFDTIVISIDAAAKKTTKGSQYGLLVGAAKAARRFILDDRTQRGSFTEILVIIRELMIKWRPRRLIIEDKAAGPDLIDTLKNELAGGKIVSPDGEVITCVVEEINPDGDKERRMEAASPTIEAKLVYLLEGAPWLDEFVSEVADFPAEPNDRGDALSQFITTLSSVGNAMWGVTPNVWATALMGAR